MLKSDSAATDLDLISYLKAIPDARMRRGVRIPAWYLLLVAVLGILSRCQSLRDLDRFAIRHHSARCQLHRRARCLAAFVTRLIVTFALAPLSC